MTKSFTLSYKKNGATDWLTKTFVDSTYENAKRVADSFPSSFSWRITRARYSQI